MVNPEQPGQLSGPPRSTEGSLPERVRGRGSESQSAKSLDDLGAVNEPLQSQFPHLEKEPLSSVATRGGEVDGSSDLSSNPPSTTKTAVGPWARPLLPQLPRG